MPASPTNPFKLVKGYGYNPVFKPGTAQYKAAQAHTPGWQKAIANTLMGVAAFGPTSWWGPRSSNEAGAVQKIRAGVGLFDPSVPENLVNTLFPAGGAPAWGGLVFEPHIGNRYALSPGARNPQRVYRTEDLYPALAFRHAGGTAGLARDITRGQGLHTPIEIDWDPVHGLAMVIQGNHRLIAAHETEHPFIPGTLGQLQGDMARWITHLKSDPNRKPYHEYGHINTGKADQGLINSLLRMSEYAHPETGGIWNYRRDPPITGAEWESLINALGLPNAKVPPGTTVEQAAQMFSPPYKSTG